MINKLSGWDDTIVALATPPGISAIGVIRVSGDQAIDIVNRLFGAKDLSKAPTQTLHVGMLSDQNQHIDEVVVSVFRSPGSYTGEDIVEISSHGSPFIQQQIIDAIIRNGARMARPGEFTQRAFLNGKLDLTQAEAVADMIAANSEQSGRAALNKIRGGFKNELSELREQLIQFSALIELELDFSEEDVEFADRNKFYELINHASATVNRLILSFKLGNAIRNGISVAIIGKPNAGKSTLLNILLKEDRAIVSEIAGTTRDTIEEVLNIKGILFRLIDTAGIREHAVDAIEHIGIGRSIDKMRESDIVLYLFDGNTESCDALKKQMELLSSANKKFILVCNKTDKGDLKVYTSKFHKISPLIFISAKKEEGIDELKQMLFNETVSDAAVTDETIITNARHVEALQKLENSISSIRNGLEQKLSGDLIAPDIRQALYYIGLISGEVTDEDTLDYIFSKFCIGK